MEKGLPELARFELRASLEGREIVFANLELWWCEPEPPEEEFPSFTLATGAATPAGEPHLEIEGPAPDATTFRDLAGAAFALAPLGAAPGGWVSVDLGKDWKSRGFAGREWVASEARVEFERLEEEGAVAGAFEAVLERSRAQGAAGGAAKIAGRFRARAPRW